jgi:hypothetical protein
MNKKKIAELANEILNGFGEWSGPDGLCWCDEKKKFIEPDSDSECTDCKTIPSTELRQIRYLRLHDDYRSR